MISVEITGYGGIAMTKVIGINGSPRKRRNSDRLLESALQGARKAGAETVKYDLFDLDYSGCRSCFACKRLDNSSYGRCALKDDLTDVLKNILEADAVIIAAPIYFGDVPGAVRNLYERLMFPGLLYDKDGKLAYEKKVKSLLIYTMNAPDEKFNGALSEKDSRMLGRFLGECSVLNVTDTLQYDDYSKYYGTQFNPEAKKQRHEEVFPEDLKKAFAMGIALVSDEEAVYEDISEEDMIIQSIMAEE